VLARAVVATVVLPGTVAYIVPLVLAPPITELRLWQLGGGGLLLLGTSLLIWCVREFYVCGKGTLAPWSPPKELVVTGPFRWSRNPMYLAVVVVLLGWSIWFASRTLLIYTSGVAIAFHLRVLLYEEPRLASGFAEAWKDYRSAVPRWLGPMGR
jgi:protein-S-isoprenylcysteine O-methyltransferase Ste14